VRLGLTSATSTVAPFQPTHPHGVRPTPCPSSATTTQFQPTHPHGVRRYAPFIIRNSNVFQPTHPHGVRHTMSGVECQATICFNPRTRTGCDRGGQASQGHHSVSTHAPARGATVEPQALPPTGRVSTHAPARGATDVYIPVLAHAVFQPTHPHGVRLMCTFLFWPTRCFNPRTRTGCDVSLLGSARYGSVSTHAPARGATPQGLLWYLPKLCFNPRTRTGCDGGNGQ